MCIDVKTDDLAQFWDSVTLSTSYRLFNFGLGQLQIGQKINSFSVQNSFKPKINYPEVILVILGYCGHR